MSGAANRVFVRTVRPRETVSEAVVLAVLETRDPRGGRDVERSLDDLADLTATLDPDALDALFGDCFNGRIEFDWSGCSIVVERGTRILVSPWG